MGETRQHGSWPQASPVRALLSLGVVAGVGLTGTHAYWTDSVAVAGTTITSGSIDLRVEGSDKVTDYAAMDLGAMVPGSSAADVLTVSNTGTVPVHYHLDAVASDPDGKGLGTALVVKVTADQEVTGTSPKRTCAGPAIPGAKSVFTTGLLGSAAAPRLLPAGGSETLCVQATLPDDAGASLQGSGTEVTLTFSGRS